MDFIRTVFQLCDKFYRVSRLGFKLIVISVDLEWLYLENLWDHFWIPIWETSVLLNDFILCKQPSYCKQHVNIERHMILFYFYDLIFCSVYFPPPELFIFLDWSENFWNFNLKSWLCILIPCPVINVLSLTRSENYSSTRFLKYCSLHVVKIYITCS